VYVLRGDLIFQRGLAYEGLVVIERMGLSNQLLEGSLNDILELNFAYFKVCI
jgi:hypothetical protein